MYNYIRKESLIAGKFQETRKIAETCLISLQYPPVQFEMASRVPEWEIIGWLAVFIEIIEGFLGFYVWL